MLGILTTVVEKRTGLVTMSFIKLNSSDEVTFVVDLKVDSYFGIINTMLDDLPLNGDGEMFQLATVNSKTLSKILTWIAYHSKNDPPTEDQGYPPLESRTDEKDEISSWDADFLKMAVEALRELILASNFLDIKGLIEITAKAAANLIKGKTVKEIRSMFNIKNDFSKEEEMEIRVNNEWTEEHKD